MTRKKFLNPADIEAALAEVAAKAAESGTSVALIGGVAMSLLGSDRLTTDVDFAASAPIGLFRFRHSLSFGGDAVTTSQGHPVDIVVRTDDYACLYEEAIRTAQEEQGLPVRVVRSEYLVAMKMVAGRDKDESDLKTLIRLKAVTFDSAAKVVRAHLGVYAVQELRNLFDEVAWLTSRDKE
jgi:predicted nucleotidyltransferase